MLSSSVQLLRVLNYCGLSKLRVVTVEFGPKTEGFTALQSNRPRIRSTASYLVRTMRTLSTTCHRERPSCVSFILAAPIPGLPVPLGADDVRHTLPQRKVCACMEKGLVYQGPTSLFAKESMTRRAMLCALVTSALSVPLASLAGLEYPELHGLDEKPDNLPIFRDVNGVKIQDVQEGSGAEVKSGTKVSVKYVLRRSNGYFIDASYGFDRFEAYSFQADSGDVVAGFDIGVNGMREGGRRRFVIPPSLGYVTGTGTRNAGPVPPDFGARRSLSSHAREPLVFEVLVVKVKVPNSQHQ